MILTLLAILAFRVCFFSNEEDAVYVDVTTYYHLDKLNQRLAFYNLSSDPEKLKVVISGLIENDLLVIKNLNLIDNKLYGSDLCDLLSDPRFNGFNDDLKKIKNEIIENCK